MFRIPPTSTPRRDGVTQFGAIDILVNNAAIAMHRIFSITEADYDRVLGINLKGSFLMLQACAREMVKQGKRATPGAIVNMSSVNDTLAIPTIVSYCVARAASHNSPARRQSSSRPTASA